MPVRRPSTAFVSLRTIAEADLARLVAAARARGLDGTDWGAVRDFLWWEWAHSDAIDHSIIAEVARRLQARPPTP